MSSPASLRPAGSEVGLAPPGTRVGQRDDAVGPRPRAARCLVRRLRPARPEKSASSVGLARRHDRGILVRLFGPHLHVVDCALATAKKPGFSPKPGF